MVNLLNVALIMARMRSAQWKDAEQLKRIQESKLQSLFTHAAAHVPHYRQAFTGKSVRSLEDLRGLPILSRQDIQGREHLFVSDTHRKENLYRIRTSGSSGLPLTAYYDKSERDHFFAMRQHILFEAGVGPFDTQAFITYRSFSPNILQRAGLYRCHYLDFSRPEEQNLQELRRLGVSAVLATPSTILPLAFRNLDENEPVGFRRFFSYAEVLSKEARAILSRSFGCSVYDRYGAIETGSIAWECPEGGMHIYSDSLIVEIVDANGDSVPEGRSGSIVLTPLWRRSMPLIRYKIGDRATLGGRCRCGRGLPLLRSIEGREAHMLMLPSGRRFLATSIGISLRSLKGVSIFQTIQERRGTLRVLVVPGRFRPEKGVIINAINSALPEPLDIEVEFVDAIRRQANGKVTDFVSRLPASAASVFKKSPEHK